MVRASRAVDAPMGGALGTVYKGGLARGLIVSALLLVMLAPSCSSRSRGRIAPVRGDEPRHVHFETDDRAPSWSTMAHSWGKLDEIERWQAKHGADASEYWRAEARLQLAEGQLRFARESGSGQNLVAYRRDAAIAGFESVASDSAAVTDQKTRARAGLQRARRIEGAPTESSAPRAAAVPIGGLVGRSAWKAARPNLSKMERSAGRWNWITVHHSVFAPNSAALADSLDTVLRIQRQHVDVEKYGDIGYHFLIDRAGRVIEGRDLRWQGAHAGGNNNRGNAGICLLGNFETEHPTKEALASLDKLVLELQQKLRIPRKNVRPHSAWKGTKCPGKHLMPWFTRR